jgi:hypothetical protein
LIIVVQVHLIGCGGEDPTGPKPDPGGAAALVIQANQELEDKLFEEINAPTNHPTDIDFGKAHDLYSQALALDPNNLDARFGVSITGLLIVTNDSEIIAAFDEWEAYLNDNTPFEVPGMASPFGIPVGIAAGSNALRLPFDIVSHTLLAHPRRMIQMANPQIGRTQDILRDRVLPKLVAAINHLGVIVGNPDYTYIVTPRMQGDVSASPAEIDLTDIHAVRAGVSLLSAVCRILISYELGIAAYDNTSLSQALMPGSSWLALRQDGAAHMSAVPADLLLATDEIDAALEALLLETDPQHDDIIKIDPSGLTQTEVNDIRAELPRVRELLNDGAILTKDWDLDPLTPPVALQVNVGDFFRAQCRIGRRFFLPILLR